MSLMIQVHICKQAKVRNMTGKRSLARIIFSQQKNLLYYKMSFLTADRMYQPALHYICNY